MTVRSLERVTPASGEKLLRIWAGLPIRSRGNTGRGAGRPPRPAPLKQPAGGTCRPAAPAPELAVARARAARAAGSGGARAAADLPRDPGRPGRGCRVVLRGRVQAGRRGRAHRRR